MQEAKGAFPPLVLVDRARAYQGQRDVEKGSRGPGAPEIAHGAPYGRRFLDQIAPLNELIGEGGQRLAALPGSKRI